MYVVQGTKYEEHRRVAPFPAQLARVDRSLPSGRESQIPSSFAHSRRADGLPFRFCLLLKLSVSSKDSHRRPPQRKETGSALGLFGGVGQLV